jgi:hypothetical protein
VHDDQGISATGYTLVDEDGRVRARLGIEPAGDVALTFFDSTGIARTKLGFRSDDSSFLVLGDGEGRSTLRIEDAANPPHGRIQSVEFWTGAGEEAGPYMALATSPLLAGNGADLVFRDVGGGEVIALKTGPAGTNPTLMLRSPEEGGGATLSAEDCLFTVALNNSAGGHANAIRLPRAPGSK